MTHRLGSWTPPDDADTALALRGVHAGYPGTPGVLDCVSVTIGARQPRARSSPAGRSCGTLGAD